MDSKTRPVADEIHSSGSSESIPQDFSEKKGLDVEIVAIPPEYDDFSSRKIFIPGDDDEFIDPRLKDYPVPLVA